MVKSRVICDRRTTIERLSHDIFSIVALSCVVGRKLDMHLFCSTIFCRVTVLWLSWKYLTTVVRLSCDKHIVVGIKINYFNKNNRMIVARLSPDTRDTVARLSQDYQISYDVRTTLIVCRTTVLHSSCNIFLISVDSFPSPTQWRLIDWLLDALRPVANISCILRTRTSSQ